ncbi:hypothetical protein MT997_05835 [Paenibacillus sp. OVF10]|nr:hypothetical protein MT997_05835 [Paenibacillus sp. OVF10]
MSRIKLALRGTLALIMTLTILVPSLALAATGDVKSIEITNSSPQKMSVSKQLRFR